MDFKANGSIKLSNITNYNTINNNAQSVFKNQFYSDANMNYQPAYDEIDYNAIDVKPVKQKTFSDGLFEAQATGAVIYTSYTSGGLKVVEKIVDGFQWAGGTIASGIFRVLGALGIISEEDAQAMAGFAEEDTMDRIAYDAVGEANEWFYEDTDIGRTINDASAIKYNSKEAQTIQKVSEVATEIVGATAVTVATGGAATPILFTAGFAEGAGETAENKFQDIENRDFWKDSIEIGVDGTIKGLSTVAYGKAGASAVNGVEALTQSGLRSTLKETLKAFNKDAIKTTIKTSGKDIAKRTALETLIDPDNILETGAVLLDDVKTYIQTGELNITEMLWNAGLVYGENYIGNLAGGILSDSVKKIDRITELYEEGQEIARNDYNVGFKSYREHAEKHVYYVTDYMKEISKDVEGINVDEALFGALTHDLGMKGGYVKYNGEYIKVDTLLENLKKQGKDISFGDIANYVRKPHPLNSALTVLTEDIIPDGVDKDVVALLAMSHSKSTSGIKYFDNTTQWNDCVDELEAALKTFNTDNNTAFTLDTKKLKNMIDDPDEFVRLQKEALIIRDGDAMSKVATINGNTYMQTGNVSQIENHTPRKSFMEAVADESVELAGLSDNLKTIDGQFIPDGDVSSGVKFHVGELNTSFNSKTDGISYYKASVDLIEPNQTPNSTLFAIKERIGEVNTYSNCSTREFVINLPEEAQNTSLGNWYQKKVKNLRTELEDSVLEQFKDGMIDELTYNKQIEFYKNIKVNFG